MLGVPMDKLGVHMYKSYEDAIYVSTTLVVHGPCTHGSHLAGAEYFHEERIAVPFYGISGTSIIGMCTGTREQAVITRVCTCSRAQLERQVHESYHRVVERERSSRAVHSCRRSCDLELVSTRSVQTLVPVAHAIVIGTG